MADLLTHMSAAGHAPTSALEPAVEPGDYGNLSLGAQVALSERLPLGIREIAVWADGDKRVAEVIRSTIGLELADGRADYGETGQAFRCAPDRWLVATGDTALPEKLLTRVGDAGVVIDLSHGLTAIRIAGEKTEWVLAKLFALDFSEDAIAPPAGLATQHRAIPVRLQRIDAQTFDLFVPRSWARALWLALTTASAEVGCRVRR